jgi:hypothetical protein
MSGYEKDFVFRRVYVAKKAIDLAFGVWSQSRRIKGEGGSLFKIQDEPPF